MATSPEARLSSQILGAIAAHWPKSQALKVHGNEYQSGGWPDILACIDGRFVALETKLPDHPHPLSKRQEVMLILLRRAGAITGVPTSVDEALAIIREGLDA